MRIAIIGGGIAGLSAAYELELARIAGVDVEYELFEAAPTLGGVIASSVIDGTVIERGPDSFLTEKPAAAELCRELGLATELVPSDDAQRKTFILVGKRLVALPDGLMFLVPTKLVPTALSGLFSIPTKIRMGLELLHPPRPHTGDESVADLVRRHYGQEAVDRLADPLLSGIYGGDAAQLSAQSVLPRLVEMEAKYGSLTKGMLAAFQNAKASRAGKATPAAQSAAAAPKSAPRALFTSLRYGLQQLIDALVERLDPQRVHTEAPVNAIERTPDGWRLTFSLFGAVTRREFGGLILATPAWSAGELLKTVDAPLGSELSGIPYSSSVTVNLVYDQAQLGPLPEGFGFLVPAVENRDLLACTFVHRKFPGRTAPGKAVIRAFLGGSRNAGMLRESDDALVETVRRELQSILHITATPELTDVRRWPRAMAQYSVGHKDRQERIRSRAAALPGMRLVGNAYDGIGISDCIRLGRGAARELASGEKAAGATPPDHPATVQSHR